MLHHSTTLPAQHGRTQQSLAVRIFDTLFDWMDRYQTRRALQSMSDTQLSDVGLTRADIHRESEKPFWRA